MKKKGFTLIELLAVIVILAIITVIAVPKILDVIDKSRKQTFIDGVKLIESGIKTQLSSSELTGESSFTKGDDNCYLFDFTNKNNNYNELKVKNKENYSGEIKYCDNKFIYTEFSDSKYTINTDENGVETIKKVGSSLNPDTGKTEEDTEKLVEPTITLTGTGSYPTLTESGIQISTKIEISNETNKTSKIMYKIDDGEYKEYTGEVNAVGNTIYAKTVKNTKESNVVTKNMNEVEVAKDAIDKELYDNDLDTEHHITGSGSKINEIETKYLLVNSSAWNNDYKIYYKTNYNSGHEYFKLIFYDKDDNEISKTDSIYSSKAREIENKKFFVPENTTKIGVYMLSYNSVRPVFIYEITNGDSVPVIERKKYCPSVTSSGILKKNIEVNINYSKRSTSNLYRINGGEWKKYNGKISLEINDILEAKSTINGVDTAIDSYQLVESSDCAKEEMYDNNLETEYDITGSGSDTNKIETKYLLVDSSAWNSKYTVYYMTKYRTGHEYAKLKFYDVYGNEISSTDKLYSSEAKKVESKEITIPKNCTMIEFYLLSYNSARPIYFYDFIKSN